MGKQPCPEAAVQVGDQNGLTAILGQILKEPTRSTIIDRIREANDRIRQEIATMWSAVDEVLASVQSLVRPTSAV